MDPIPVNDLQRHNAPILDRIAARAESVLRGGWYILGPAVKEFERSFAAYCGVKHAIGVANGTDALELALRACGVGPGDRVLTVANAGGYSTAAIRLCGADPVYADIEPASMLLDVAEFDRLAQSRELKAVIVTHLYGRMADLPAILEIARRAGLPVIEDCAQAHGARLQGRHAGTWGSIGCFSFYPTKNLGALGDGGALITDNDGLAQRLRRLRQYGWSGKYASAELGRNSRLDELQAAILTEKLSRLDAWNARRRAIAARYSEALSELGLTVPAVSGENYAAHLYVVRTRDRDRMRAALTGCGIGTDVHYPVPDHWQESARGLEWARVQLPVTEQCAGEVLTLPCFPELTDDEAGRVIEAIRGA